MIWGFAARPRLVTMQQVCLSGAAKDHCKDVPAPIPGHLHANKESRTASDYVIIDGTWSQGTTVIDTRIIIYLERDILLATSERFLVALLKPTSSTNLSPWLIELKRLAILFDDAVSMLIWSLPAALALWKLLHTSSPQLVELIILLRSGPAGADVEDMFEMVGETPYQWTYMDLIGRSLRNAQGMGLCTGLTLKFMRNETWAR